MLMAKIYDIRIDESYKADKMARRHMVTSKSREEENINLLQLIKNNFLMKRTSKIVSDSMCGRDY